MWRDFTSRATDQGKSFCHTNRFPAQSCYMPLMRCIALCPAPAAFCGWECACDRISRQAAANVQQFVEVLKNDDEKWAPALGGFRRICFYLLGGVLSAQTLPLSVSEAWLSKRVDGMLQKGQAAQQSTTPLCSLARTASVLLRRFLALVAAGVSHCAEHMVCSCWSS